MKRLIFALLLLPVSMLLGKNCPSILQSNMRQIAELPVYYGLEFRTIHYYENDYVYETDERVHRHIGMVGVNGAGKWSITDDLIAFTELTFRMKNIGNCYYDELSPVFQIRQAYVEWQIKNLKLSAGRQNLVFGSQALLDNWFDAATIEYKFHKKFTASVFGGVFIPALAREMAACLFERVYEYRGGWKKLCSSAWGDDIIAGGVLTFNFFKKHPIQVMYLLQQSNHSDLSANYFSAFTKGPLPGKRFSYYAEVMYQHKTDGASFPAFVGVLGKSFRLKKMMLEIQAGWAGTLAKYAEDRFTPIFETMHMGRSKRYSLYNGHTRFARFKLKLPKQKMNFQLAYYNNTQELMASPNSDELELGVVKNFFKGHVKVWLFYSLGNITGDYAYRHLLELQIRWAL